MPGSKFDLYTAKARVTPALLVALPVAIATLAWLPGGVISWATLWALVTWSGGTLLVAQLGRDAGRRKQDELFRSWGGMPTTRMLRHRDATNAITLDRRHRKLKSLMKTVKLPTAEEERADPAMADEIYEACVTLLREKTRDKKQFPLVFDENCSYGFRRNLWGLKPLGIAVSVVAVVAVVALPLVEPTVWSTALKDRMLVPLLVNLVLVVGWLSVVTPRWVKLAADAYGQRLLESCERL